MTIISREQLHAYLDDALPASELATIERQLRESAKLREQLQSVREERDRGEHSLGGIWRRERLSCLSRADLNGYLHGLHEPALHQYIEFHLQTIVCATCLANLEDLRERQTETTAPKRRKKIFDSSAGLLAGRASDGL